MSLTYFLYSPNREMERYRNKDLVVDLEAVLKPEIWQLPGKTITRDNKNNCVHLDLSHPYPVPPFYPTAEQASSTLPYLVNGIVIRDFRLWLDSKIRISGSREYFKPTYDPRRLVVELELANPIARLHRFVTERGTIWGRERANLYLGEKKIPERFYQLMMENIDSHERTDRELLEKLTWPSL